MKGYTSESIRNIALVGHGGCGKTTFLEAALLATGVIKRLGRVEDGNTVSDFDKLEMESFSLADTSYDEHRFFVAVQEYLLQQLGLPYHVLQKCTADIGKPNARGVDMEAWLPGQNQYRETHTADYMTDYQARRLQTRVRREHGPELVHTNDATAFALGRAMIAIIENYQNEDGTVTVPEALRPYLGGREVL